MLKHLKNVQLLYIDKEWEWIWIKKQFEKKITYKPDSELQK